MVFRRAFDESMRAFASEISSYATSATGSSRYSTESATSAPSQCNRRDALRRDGPDRRLWSSAHRTRTVYAAQGSRVGARGCNGI